MNKPIREVIQAGALARRRVLDVLTELGIEYTEEKGWLDSIFYVYCTDAKLLQLKQYLCL